MRDLFDLLLVIRGEHLLFGLLGFATICGAIAGAAQFFVILFSEALEGKFSWERDVPRIALIFLFFGMLMLIVPATLGGVFKLDAKFFSGSISHPGTFLICVGLLGLWTCRASRKRLAKEKRGFREQLDSALASIGLKRVSNNTDSAHRSNTM